MQFFEIYRKKYNDLLIAIENFDISLSEEFTSLRAVNSEKLIKHQLRKFQLTFEMLIEQMRLYLKKNHVKVPSAGASIISDFHKHSNLLPLSYEILLDMNISYKKIVVQLNTSGFLINNEVLKSLDSYYTTMLMALKYLDYDDAKLFKSNKKKSSLREFEFV